MRNKIDRNSVISCKFQQKLKVLRQTIEGLVKEPNMFHNYETEKITRKASDAAENLQLYRVFGSSVRDHHARRI